MKIMKITRTAATTIIIRIAEVATTMKIAKITHAVATIIIIRMAKAAEDTTIKVIITNSKAASKDIPVSIVDLLVMEI